MSLERLQKVSKDTVVMMGNVTQRETSTTATVERGSVAEEATATDLSSASASQVTHLQEKLKAAAAARVQAELDVQRYRWEQEKATEQVQKLNKEKHVLNEQVQSLEHRLARIKERQSTTDSPDRKEKLDAAQKEPKSVQDLLQKRIEQQAKLEIVENELHERAQRVRQMQMQQPASQDSAPRLSPKEYRALSDEEKGRLKTRREAMKAAQGIRDAKSSDEHHPLLGPIVADLGYKRVHLVSSGKLGTIPIWEKQRTYRNSRAKSMAADKHTSIDLGFPGIICLYEDRNGGLSILDGQHRVGMMQALREKRNQQEQQESTEKPKDIAGLTENEFMYDNVLVEVYVDPGNVSSNITVKHAERVFLEINKAEPIKLIDMPGVAPSADRTIISEAVDELYTKFPRMFSPSQRNRVPNVNVDNLRNSVYGANVLRRHKLTSSKKLFDWLIVQNASLGAKYEQDKKRQGYVSPRSWNKASRNGFYLGLDNWLYQ